MKKPPSRRIDFEGVCLSMGRTDMAYSGVSKVNLITRSKDDGSLTPVFVLVPFGDPVLSLMTIGKTVLIRGTANCFEMVDEIFQSNQVIIVTALERGHLC